MILQPSTWMRRTLFPAVAGAMVMAVGIFILAALQCLPLPVGPATQALCLVLPAIWAVLALAYLDDARHGMFARHIADPVGAFAVGAWVAGTGIVAEVLHLAFPAWRSAALAFAVAAALLWLWYLPRALRGFRALLAGPPRRATGSILLTTVSTQSIVILGAKLLPGGVPRAPGATLLILGYCFYALGATLIARRAIRQRGWRLADEWGSAQCILHGALSISGLAIVLSGALPAFLSVLTWCAAAALFLVVEGIEVARLVLRVRAYGWRRGVFTYDASQWARNFTFGMFYAFTRALDADAGARSAIPALGGIWRGILDYGQYVVLALLLIELGLLISAVPTMWRRGPRN